MARYIVVKEKDAHWKMPMFFIYKKGWLFNTCLKVSYNEQEAIDFVLNCIKNGEAKFERTVVFDSKKSLSFDIHF